MVREPIHPGGFLADELPSAFHILKTLDDVRGFPCLDVRDTVAGRRQGISGGAAYA